MSSAVARSLRSAPASARRLPGRAVLSRARSTAAVGVADDAEPQGSLFNPTAEHYALRELCAAFVRDEVEPQALEFNRAERFNHPLFRRAGELGLLGVTVDPEYGGAGMDAAAACIVHEELSASDPAFCLSYLAHSQLFVNNLARNGSAEQKAAWLPAACSGEAIGGMGMSEPEAGTDVLGMRTRAEQQADGSWLLNGGKMWITNGAVSDTELGDRYLIYARTAGPEVKASKAVSLFYVERGMAGFSLGQRLKDKCGMRASPTAELVFENVPLPAANLIGQPGGATVCMMRNLEIERVVLAAMGVGIARRSLEAMNAYATDRRAFGASLRDFGQIQRHIAESYAEYMAGKTYLYQTALGLDLDAAGNRLDTDGVKLYCTTMGKNVADRAIQVMGGYGYMGEYAVERLWRDAKLLEIGGGTLESHHKNMVRDMSQLDAMP
ncbi:long-chain specific acyl-CoA dehydrogenase [Emiliania huxleyi CCMP1516]|uniref:Isovaleryl-CoA dehydrogenase n=4 Tax=Emiliania huxleyi TaxID=2903 RepID=A0A0D3JBV2_EMIH1|nr:long-chain specific acyl-CoA dehydrogenase [Emiliania huxleyi CCMP1516]EOD20987.1 long-chain specific acyl-CoA dehydrogenase [Emiliania huxleyi CCMP1516]|eukprot:XP_005773416.1 long-chain specific acyl-CoA dehydrogenase [Emiliania huxleyi CCMP1516]